MKRARATRLALVNWKGLVYEEIELDEGVTALEGETGAGKTTLMIGAYTVLLPDLTYLRFTNVGESGSSGGDAGIWGRLGEPGPAYAWLDLALPRSRVVAGVHLHRLAAPRLEISPFLIEGVPEDLPLEWLVMRRHEQDLEVPEPNEIPHLALAAGANPRAFGGDKKGYFKALFDLGITPLRMATGEERKKLDEMMHTCMMGGISDVMRTGLRDFLFAENPRLADTIRRMERNLDACRRTRAEVQLNEKLQAEISRLYAAGEGAFVAATRAVARWEREQGTVVRDLALKQAEAETHLAEKQRQEEAASRELAEIQERREDLEGRLRRARGRVESVEKALELTGRLHDERSKLADAEAELRDAARAKETAEEARDRSTEAETGARSRADDAAKNLSSHQEAFEDLSRKVGLHRAAVRHLADAGGALGEDLAPAGLAGRLRETEAEAVRLRGEHVRLEIEIQDAEEHARRHWEGLAALREVLGAQATPADLDRATELRAKLERAKADLPELRRRLEAEDAASRNQAVVRQRAQALGLSSRAQLGSETEAGQERLDALDGELDDLRRRLATLESEAGTREKERDQAAAQVGPWVAFREQVAEEAGLWGGAASAGELREVHDRVVGEARAAEARLHDAALRCAELRERIRDLEDKASLPEHVLASRDALDAELVAEHFDDVPLSEAAWTQAALGPAAHALLVVDPPTAARHLSAGKILDPGEEVLLLRGVPDPAPDTTTTDEDLVLVQDPRGVSVRVVNPPTHPVIGRAARQRVLEQHRSELTEAEQAEDCASEEAGCLVAARDRLLDLLDRARLLDEPDPRPVVERLGAEVAALQRQVEELTRAHSDRAGERGSLATRLGQLRRLLPDAALLDPPDHEKEAQAAKVRLDLAQADERRLRDHAAAWQRLDARAGDLRVPPLDEPRREAIRRELDGIAARWRTLLAAIMPLTELVANPEPLGWGWAVGVLAETGAITGRLEGVRQRAVQELKQATGALEAARIALDEASSEFNRAEQKQLGLAREVERLGGLLDETGITEPTEQVLDDAQETLDRLDREREDRRCRESELLTSLGGLRTERQALERSCRDLAGQRETAAAEHGNRVRTWERYREAAATSGLRPDRVVAEDPGGGGSVGLFAEAKGGVRTVLALLPDEPELRGAYEAIGEGQTIEHVEAWARLRGSLHRRIGPHVSESDDVVEALKDLGRRLDQLQRRLGEHERELRTDAGAIGTTIQSQRRRAYGLVRKLGDALSGVRFGTIRSIRLKVEPLAKMDELLKALSGQFELFAEPRPIEDVLVDLFESIGGGKVNASRLLDYRQYFRVRVEALRDDGTTVGARGDQMSTGEAIGTGAAVMMVVLQAWEEHSEKLRKRHQHGTLRFLFLDEATRLSRKGLLALFDLCAKLELQLLIAAPDVPLVEGGTRYVLVRADNRVVIHGRTVVAHGVGA